MVGEIGAQVLRSTDVLGIGRVFETFDRPSLKVTRSVKDKKGETVFELDVSKFDVIVGLIVAAALYIAAKRHSQGQSASEDFYGNMMIQNPLAFGTGSPAAGAGQGVGTWNPFSGFLNMNPGMLFGVAGSQAYSYAQGQGWV